MVLEEPKNILGKKLVDLANCFQIIFSLSLSADSSHILGQACASMGSDSDISDSHPHVW